MSDSINALIAGQHNASVIDSLANPPQVNMLGSITRATEAAQGVMRMRALKAQQAWGNALQQATDPKTGAVDYPHAQAIAAQDPDAVMGMAAGLEGASGRMNDQVSRGHVMNGWLQGTIGALPDNATRQQIIDTFNRGGASGILPSDIVAKEIASVPTDPAKMPAYIQQMRISAGSLQDQLKVHYGEPITIAQGSQVQPAMRSPMTGGVTPSGAPIPLYASPETQGGMVTWVDKDSGATQHTTWADYNTALGNGRVVGPPKPDAPAAAPTPGAPAPAPGAPAAPRTISGPAAGMPEKWKASSDQYNRDNEAAGSYQQRVFPLAQVASILASGDVTTGQGADAINRAKSFLQTVATSMGWDAQTIQQADYDKVVKYMQQYVNAQGMSQRSDQALASALTGNPSAHLSTIANKDVIKPLIGMERMRQMAITDFKAQNGNPRDYSDFLAKWQNTHDPRAFIFDMLGKDERTKMITGMKTAEERKRFSDTLDIVERNPGLMGQAALPH